MASKDTFRARDTVGSSGRGIQTSVLRDVAPYPQGFQMSPRVRGAKVAKGTTGSSGSLRKPSNPREVAAGQQEGKSVDTPSPNTLEVSLRAEYCAMDTPRTNTLEVSLRAQGRAESAGAIQLSSGERNVALFEPMPAEPRTQWVVGKWQTNIRSTRCSPLPARSVIFLEYLKINLISSIWSSKGVDFVKCKSFPSSEGRPRGSASSPKPSPNSSSGRS